MNLEDKSDSTKRDSFLTKRKAPK